MIELHAAAKINLFLHVTGRRPDGYHELVSLMCRIDLYDTLLLDTSASGIHVDCRHPDVPEGRKNLAYRAADLFFQTAGYRPAARVVIEKRIPVGAGLGGGSSDAAAVLRGLNQACGHPLSLAQLQALGLEIGADVPFFIDGRPSLATGVGERLDPFPNLDSHPLVTVFPGVAVSTAAIYKNLNLGLTKCQKQLKSFLLNEEKFNVNRHLCNDLESVAVARFPRIETAKQALLARGAAGALMSGSGSAVFGLFDNLSTARRVAQSLTDRHNRWSVHAGRLLCGPDSPAR
jgi:4-diphosphocytidyl-2-C-methyl-D-erythritol kinase